jgi:hypothetical protein
MCHYEGLGPENCQAVKRPPTAGPQAKQVHHTLRGVMMGVVVETCTCRRVWRRHSHSLRAESSPCTTLRVLVE